MRRLFRILGSAGAFAVVVCGVSLAGYTITIPNTGSSHGKTETIAGGGQGPIAEAGVFAFWRLKLDLSLDYKREVGILAVAAMPMMDQGPWSKDLTPPASGWKLSPEPMPGMWTADHTASVARGTGTGVIVDGTTGPHKIFDDGT